MIGGVCEQPGSFLRYPPLQSVLGKYVKQPRLVLNLDYKFHAFKYYMVTKEMAKGTTPPPVADSLRATAVAAAAA